MGGGWDSGSHDDVGLEAYIPAWKRYLVVSAVTAALTLVLAERWRRTRYGDSYLNYLSPVQHDPPTRQEGSPARWLRGAADRVWGPVAAAGNADRVRLQRIRTGFRRPTSPAAAPAAPAADSA